MESVRIVVLLKEMLWASSKIDEIKVNMVGKHPIY